MTDLRYAAQQALEALEEHGAACLHHEAEYSKAITALKATLEQPEQAEPVEKQRDELLEALRECLPYVRETLLNTGSMDAYYTETKATVAIKKAEGNT